MSIELKNLLCIGYIFKCYKNGYKSTVFKHVKKNIFKIKIHIFAHSMYINTVK